MNLVLTVEYFGKKNFQFFFKGAVPPGFPNTPLITIKLPYVIKLHETEVTAHSDYFLTLEMSQISR